MKTINLFIVVYIFCVLLISTEVLSLTKLNILFVIVDDLRPALGCYNSINSVSPNIDNLAKRSIIFSNAYAQQALCAPSRNSLLTSRRPDTLHLYDFYNYWRNFTGNFTTLPQHFKENGYHTHSIGKVFHPGISSNWNDDQPFSWSEQPYHPPTEKYKEASVCINKHGNLERDLVCPVVTEFQPGKSLPDIQSLKAAQEFLHRRKGNTQPFFLAVGFHKPHVPIKFPYRYLDFHPIEKISLPRNRWRPALLPTVAWNPWTDVRDRDDIAALNISFPFGVMPDKYSKLIRQSYFSAVTYIDDLMGQLLDTLVVTGHGNNTIIILIGDHGWSLGEHGEWSKYSNFEVSVKVPFLLCVPGLTTSVKSSKPYFRTDALVELVDIFPTLVDLTGVSALPPLCLKNCSHIKLCTEGISLLPLIKDEIQMNSQNPSSRYRKTGVFSQYPRPGVFPTMHPNSDKPRLKDIKIMGYSLRTQKYRYTEWVNFDIKTFQADWSQLYGQELYDHSLDHDENINMVDRIELKSVVKTLQHQLHAGWKYNLPKYVYNNNML